jgi:electron transport complex protein RnfE
VFISALKTQIPDNVRIPAFIVVIASFTTIVQLLMEAFTPDLFAQLGIFIPLIVVNCIVLGRAEAFAAKNNVWSSLLDGAGMGIGFTLALTLLGGLREILGSGSIFDYKFIAGDGIIIFILAPGAFLTLGFLIALINHLKKA